MHLKIVLHPDQCVCVQDRERKRQKLADASADAYIGADLTNGGGANVVSPAAEEPVKPQVQCHLRFGLG